MAPFVNRIAGGRFRFGGVDHVVPPDPAGGPHALHGDGWRRPWTVESVAADTARLSLTDGAAWPWRRRIEHSLTLTDRSLHVAAEITNTDDRAMPAGLGWHPTFARRALAGVRLSAGGFHPTTDDLPRPPEALPSDWPFASGVSAASLAPIDHCLTGWGGVADIVWPDISVRLAAVNCRFLQVYVPTGGDGFCLEPQTSAPNAVNHGEDFGLRILPPGGRLAIEVSLTIL